jgi:hypothetical protein
MVADACGRCSGTASRAISTRAFYIEIDISTWRNRQSRRKQVLLEYNISEFKLAVLAGSSTPDSTDLRQRPADYFFRDVKEYRVLDSYLYRLVC